MISATDDMISLEVVKPSFEMMTPRVVLAHHMKLLEEAGRTCYQSEAAMHADSADDFIKNIIKAGHESVIEHCTITGRFIGSRTMSHQLVRHRIAAYSQESQRYCDAGKKGLKIIVPPTIGDIPEGTYSRQKDDRTMWSYGKLTPRMLSYLNSAADAYQLYKELRADKIKSEDARFVLQNMTKTEVVATYNLRTWRHVFVDRALNPRAQWEIKMLMRQALRTYAQELPIIFGGQVETLAAMETSGR